MPVEAASNKSKVEKTINTFYSAAKHYNVKKMKSCFTKGSLLKAFVTMKEMAAFCKKRNWRIDYEIKSIKINGRNAVAKVYCEYPYAYDAFKDAFFMLTIHIMNNPNLSDRQMQQYAHRQALKYLKIWGLSTEEDTIIFRLKKVGSKWKIKKSSVAILDSIHCGYESAYRDYFA